MKLVLSIKVEVIATEEPEAKAEEEADTETDEPVDSIKRKNN